ncbi:MAG: cytochrome c biogenesis protein CcdA, partial [Candidatus Paceibacteria bacterium]
VATIFGWKVFYGFVVPQANNIAVFSTLGLFAFAALAGIMVNFGPCSLAVLPAYMSFYLGLNTKNQNVSALKSAKLGAIASFGVVGFYLVLGLLFATAGTFLAAYAPQLKLAIAALILILGVMLLRGRSLELDFISRFKDSVNKASAGNSHIASLLGFGVVYGAGGLSCFLPIFLPLVFFPFVGGQFFLSIASFAIFALFQAFFLIGATILVGLGKQTIFRKMIDEAETMKKIAGVILILTSVYMFGIFVFLGM